MALCEKFSCSMKCPRKRDNCKETCIHAHYIHKCSMCSNRKSCKGSELFKKWQAVKKAEMDKWIKD